MVKSFKVSNVSIRNLMNNVLICKQLITVYTVDEANNGHQNQLFTM